MMAQAARGKRRSPEVARGLVDPVPILTVLGEELSHGRYVPGRARGFVIHEPKRRVISALPFRDRIVQHYLINATLPALEGWFAPQSYACRCGYGTHRALRRAIELHRTHPWLLRLDIRKFFPSIDHELLLRILLPRCTQELRWLVRRIVAAPGHVEPVAFHFPGDDLFTPFTRAHGLPVGNLTSQIWANAYLTPVDHLLASQLGIGTFVRYCDDIIIYSHCRATLEAAWESVQRRCDSLRLRLHPTKCRLHRTSEPVAFLGFVLERRGNGVSVRIHQENVHRMRRRMRAWLAHAHHGTTRTLILTELDRLGNLLEP